MTTSRNDEETPTFYQFTELPIELQQYIGSMVDNTTLLRLATRSREQLGLHQNEIMKRFMASHRVVQIAGTTSASFFLTDEGFLYACGSNRKGELGIGDREPRVIPTRISGIAPVEKIIDKKGSFFLDRAGLVWENRYDVMLPLNGLPLIIDACAYPGDILLLAENGEVYARTAGGVAGRFGLDHALLEDITDFRKVPGLSKIKKICGMAKDSAFYIDKTGKAFGGGPNEVAQLAVRSRDRISGVAAIPPLSAASPAINEIWSNGVRTYIQLMTDDVYACGKNDIGQLGIGILSECCVNPVFIPQLKNLKKTYFHINSTYALTHDGKVFSWGENTDGQLALGDQENRLLPTLVADLPPVEEIDFSDGTVLFYTKAKETYICGSSIQIWPGMAAESHTSAKPLLVPLLQNLKSSWNGRGVFTFLRNDGVMYGWGDNHAHALGLSDEFYSELQLIELPPVVQHVNEASLAVLLYYANQGREYYHEVCLSLALKKLRAELTSENIKIALPFLRHRHEAAIKELLPGSDMFPMFISEELQDVYAHLLCSFAQLQGSLKLEIEQQRNFILMLRDIVEQQEKSERDEDDRERRRERGREDRREREQKTIDQSRARQQAVKGLRRFGAFAKELQGMPVPALEQAARILVDSLPMPELPELKRKAEEPVEEGELRVAKKAKQ